MRTGRNDKCPCGSGLKYKKCCLDKENYKEVVNKLFAKIKSINDELLHKSNEYFYVSATFEDAMYFTISCNALSFIKSYMNNNHYNFSNALNLRNIIECMALYYMKVNGKVADWQEKLFLEQYKIIEYGMYAERKDRNYNVIIDSAELEVRYMQGREKFLEHISESKLKKITKTQAPFLCDESISFHKIIEENIEILLKPYIMLSMMIHPSSNEDKPYIKYYNDVSYTILKSLEALFERLTPKNTVDYYREQKMVCYNYYNGLTMGYKTIYQCVLDQAKVLEEIKSFFDDQCGEKTYVANFVKEVIGIFIDVNLDAQHGFTENVKLKFKVIAEMIALFDFVYFDPNIEKAQYKNVMLGYHDDYSNFEFYGRKITDEEFNIVYKEYKNFYKESLVSKDKFITQFKKGLGAIIDEHGTVPTYTKLVKDYFNKIFADVMTRDDKMLLKDFFWIIYDESQKMSHGCGYLYFANTGAWNDFISVINFMDMNIGILLNKFKMFYGAYAVFDKRNIPFVEFFEEKQKQMKEITDIKDIELLREKVPKNF